MGLKQCDKCNEMVDEAKAFCPGCGNAFVEEEKRQDKSEFDRMDSTVQLGKTMYGQMLSDMGLNISKAPNPAEKRIEVLAPVAAAAKSPELKPDLAKPTSNAKWLILAGVALILALGLLVILAAAVVIYYLPRFS